MTWYGEAWHNIERLGTLLPPGVSLPPSLVSRYTDLPDPNPKKFLGSHTWKNSRSKNKCQNVEFGLDLFLSTRVTLVGKKLRLAH